MTADTMKAQFESRFGKIHGQYLALYISLRSNGDAHSDAVETVLCEIQMAKMAS